MEAYCEERTAGFMSWQDEDSVSIAGQLPRAASRPDPAIPIPITRIGIQKQVYTILTPGDSFLCMRR